MSNFFEKKQPSVSLFLAIVFFFTFSLILQSCEDGVAITPKPRGFPRVVYPEKTYQAFEQGYCDFSFEYPKKEQDSIVLLQKTHEYLPLSLYFHNDEPDCCTMKTTTEKTYKDSYIDYFQMKENLIMMNGLK